MSVKMGKLVHDSDKWIGNIVEERYHTVDRQNQVDCPFLVPSNCTDIHCSVVLLTIYLVNLLIASDLI